MPTIYYVYQYLRSDGTPYYIGKGHGNRARSKAHNVHLPKDQTRIVMIKENMLETDALAMEIELIAKYGRKDIGTGILRNLTNGGEGVSGYIFTEAQRNKIKDVWASPGFRDKMVCIQKISSKLSKNTPEALARASATTKKRYEDPEARIKTSVAGKKAWENLEIKVKRSAAIKLALNRPEIRAKFSAVKNTPEAKMKNSASAKVRWKNPEYRERVLAARKKSIDKRKNTS